MTSFNNQKVLDFSIQVDSSAQYGGHPFLKRSSIRAEQAWRVLIRRAKEGKTITSEDLALEMGDGMVYQGHRWHLDRVLFCCRAEGYPELTILVRPKYCMNPATNVHDRVDLDTERRKVYAFD